MRSPTLSMWLENTASELVSRIFSVVDHWFTTNGLLVNPKKKTSCFVLNVSVSVSVIIGPEPVVVFSITVIERSSDVISKKKESKNNYNLVLY